MQNAFEGDFDNTSYGSRKQFWNSTWNLQVFKLQPNHTTFSSEKGSFMYNFLITLWDM